MACPKPFFYGVSIGQTGASVRFPKLINKSDKKKTLKRRIVILTKIIENCRRYVLGPVEIKGSESDNGSKFMNSRPVWGPFGVSSTHKRSIKIEIMELVVVCRQSVI